MRDQVVEEIAVEVERARTQRGQAIEPRHDRLLVSVREADVGVADEQDRSSLEVR